MKKTVLLLFGGKSAEHEVSIRSAKNIFKALDKAKYQAELVGISKEGTWYHLTNENNFPDLVEITDEDMKNNKFKACSLQYYQGQTILTLMGVDRHFPIDIAFPILHGTYGEDGTIQGLFKMVQVPFVGCGVLASAAGMDKEVMKRLLACAKIPTAPYILLEKNQKVPTFLTLSEKLGLPFFIKPANAGSSVGVHKIRTAEEFRVKLADSFQFDTKVLAEKMILGRELECSVKGLNHSPVASNPGEVIPKHDFYSYEAKYQDQDGASIEIPANITQTEKSLIQKTACETYTAMGCTGLTRVDFFLTKEGQVVVNEINTMPGFTQISMYPKMWESSGVSYSALVTDLIELGFQQFKGEAELKTSYL